MTLECDIERFRELYKNIDKLPLKARLEQRIAIMRSDEHLNYFGRIVCDDLFSHDNLDIITVEEAELFLERTGLFVSACLGGKPRQ